MTLIQITDSLEILYGHTSVVLQNGGLTLLKVSTKLGIPLFNAEIVENENGHHSLRAVYPFCLLDSVQSMMKTVSHRIDSGVAKEERKNHEEAIEQIWTAFAEGLLANGACFDKELLTGLKKFFEIGYTAGTAVELWKNEPGNVVKLLTEKLNEVTLKQMREQ